jgi:type II secretory pathway component GspD/PulD (secretin)
MSPQILSGQTNAIGNGGGGFGGGIGGKGGGLPYITQTNYAFNDNFQVTRYFASMGINLTNNGAFAFFNQRTGDILVRTTAQDLAKVESAIAQLNKLPPQVQIDVKFASMPAWFPNAPVFNVDAKDITKITISPSGTHGGAAPSFQAPPATANPSGIFPAVYNGTTRTKAVILYATEWRVLLTAIERQANANILVCPRITTESGRKAHIGVPNIVAPGDTNSFQEAGPTVDVLPTISADGFSIHLVLNATNTEFVGYDNPVTAHLPVPHYRVRQTAITTNVFDGDTLVLRQFPEENATNQNPVMLIFITPTLIDPAGNRVHTDEEMPIARPQPGPNPPK